MKKQITFVDAEGVTLFSEVAEVLPRPGDSVTYSMESRDLKEWAPESWNDRMEVSGKSWVVKKIDHEFRCMSILNTLHVIFVTLTPDPDA